MINPKFCYGSGRVGSYTQPVLSPASNTTTHIYLFVLMFFQKFRFTRSLHGPYLTLTSTMTPQKLDTTPPIPKRVPEITRTSPYREKFRGSEHLKLRVGIFFDKESYKYKPYNCIAWKNYFKKKFS